MHFVYPAFLFALAALAIPVIVHLFNFRRYQKVLFSNVQFLKEVQEQRSSRRNLRERIVLVCRLGALAFLVLAFARPYIPDQNTISAGQQRVVSIFVDNSYSMRTLNAEGSLLDEAKRRAKEIASAYSINDRFQLLTQDLEGGHQRLLDRNEFNDAVDAVKVSTQSHTLQQIITRQQGALQQRDSGLVSTYIISDLQKNATGTKPLKVTPGVRLDLVQVIPNSVPNVAVDSVWLISAVHRPGETEKLAVKLHNYSSEDAQRIPLKLVINGQQKALGSFNVKAGVTLTDTLTFSGLQAGWQQGEVQLQDAPVTYDDQFYFTFHVKEISPVLLINRGEVDRYLQAAYEADPFFKPVNATDGNVNYAGLGGYLLVVLSNVKSVSAGLAQQLRAYVAKGGTLSVFPPADADLASYQALLRPAGAAYPEKLITEDVRVSALNVNDPVFRTVFEDVPHNPDLPLVHQYFRLSGGSTVRANNLMELPGRLTFWGRYPSGAGSIYVSAVALNERMSNLPRHALLLPILYRMALLSGHDQPLAYTIGSNVSIEVPPVQVNEKQLLKLIKGDVALIPEVRQQDGNMLLYIADQVQQPGNYQLKKQDSLVAMLAFNSSRAESDLTYMNKADLKQLLPGNGSVIQAGKAPLQDVIADTNFGLQLWKLCIILALIFIAAEILLLRFFKTDKQQAAASW
ncbi:BatA domain-containing protein [Mucilaginibacter daejeonensis]|uniref:BatA domain-containing protein n=1 Tax=Mucilaginibacter daejeonensis TaxID=398049 RepID=UPI001D170411|nr:BatA domain-containing protein [Mucilaginibacter daejeonensis]UEG52534.1 BatA domain-containing protein [Mucilaginibacter daejeonensis]